MHVFCASIPGYSRVGTLKKEMVYNMKKNEWTSQEAGDRMVRHSILSNILFWLKIY